MDPSENLEWEVQEGNLEEVADIITKYGISHRPEWSNGYTLLRDALFFGNLEVAQFLLGRGCNVNSKRNTTFPTATVLHYAARRGNLEILKTLLEKGAYVNVTDYDGNTPLHEAVKRKDVGLTVLLVEHGANVNTSNKNGETPLHVASEKGLNRNAEHLLNHGANVNSVCTKNFKKCYTPLHFAAKNGYEGIVKILLDKGAYVNFTDNRGNTPLHEAVKRKDVGTTVLLMEYGANVNASNKNGETPLYVALRERIIRNGKYIPIEETNLNSMWTNSFKTDNSQLHCTADGYDRIVKILIDNGAYVNVTDNHGNTPLHEAVKRKDVGTTVLLMEYGANVNASNKNGETPLHVASEKGRIRNAEQLLKHGADVHSMCNRLFKEGYTPLHFAAEKGYEEIAGLLLHKGASVNALSKGRTISPSVAREVECARANLLKPGIDVSRLSTAATQFHEGHRPLHLAVRKGHGSVARILLECGANVDAQGKSGHTILHEAVSTTKASMVEMVLNYRPDVNNENNRSSLNHALNGRSFSYRKIVELLIQNGFNIRDEADVNAVYRSCKPSIHAAALNGYVTVLEALLEHGASANSKDKNGQTLLYAAAKKGNMQVIETLLKYGADIDYRDQSGGTALHIASWLGNPKVVRVLIDHGSDVNIADSSNRTALDFAEKGKYEPFREANLNDSDYDSLCFQDDKVHNKFYLYDDIHKILNYHIIKLKTANLPVSHKNLRSIKYDQTMIDFEEECKNEFETLRETFIGNTKHSFYHLLSESVHQLAIILVDDNCASCVTPDHINEKFPLYGSIICGHLTIAKHRRKILDEINACEMQIFPKLNWYCTKKIITYLSNGDLMNVMHAYKRKPKAL